MTQEYEVKRYGSYFGNWCQAFGVHDALHNENTGNYCLISEKQVGITLDSALKKQLFKEVLRKKEIPEFIINEEYARIGDLFYPFSGVSDKKGYDAIANLLRNGECHLFLTSHFAYGTDTRILTLANEAPLYILYKQIGRIHVKLD